MARTDVHAIKKALVNLDFPASKEQILAAATEAGADAETLRALRALPPVDYRNLAEVVRSADLDPAELEGQTPSEKALQARRHDKYRVAEHMREV
jgi:hypothetical protein